MFFKRRRKSVLLMAALIVLCCYFADFGLMIGQPSRPNMLDIQGGELFDFVHNSSSNGRPELKTLTIQSFKSNNSRWQDADDSHFLRLMQERQRRLILVCHSRKLNRRYLQSKIPIVNVAQRFLHCPLTKAASTFWGRFVLTLNRSGPMKSPFNYRLLVNTTLPKTLLTQTGNDRDRQLFVQRSFKTLFVREPYHRMFSAYVDKILGPNPYFWKEWGTAWRRLNHQPLGWRISRQKVFCYDNITFAQVMMVAAATFHKSEMHFIPASVMCNPCEFHYDFIGKMETFSQDLTHLSKILNLTLSDYFSSEEFALDYARDAIEDSINSPFAWQERILVCISKYEMGMRIWRKMQIRGLVDRRIQFPFSQEGFQKVTAPELVSAAFQAHLSSTDQAQLQRQKREAFVEAFRSVDLGSLQRLREAFKDDFRMFGYDTSPTDVFGHSGPPLNVTGALDWSRPWLAEGESLW